MIKNYLIWTVSVVVLTSYLQYCEAQCNGPPLYILPNNSTGNLAFPESNLDPITRRWSSTQSYPVSSSCTWILKAPLLHVIYLEIRFFDTEEKFDTITMYPTEEREKELFKFSGDLKDVWEMITPGNTLVVDFSSDGFTTYYGFHFVFMYLPQACVNGGAIVNEPQLIALPPWNLIGALPGPSRPGFEPPPDGRGIPLLEEMVVTTSPRWDKMSTYPQGLNCTWHLPVPSAQILQIDVLQFETDADDILQVWEVDGIEMKPILKFWSDQIPRRQIRSSTPLVFNFISSVQDHGSTSGFLLNVTYISRACDSVPQIFSEPHGYIAYPRHNLKGDHWDLEDLVNYGPDSCDWTVKAPEGYALNITILFFDTELQDQLEITDGNTKLFSHGGSFPNQTQVISKSNQLNLHLSSKFGTQKTGFLLSYSWTLKECHFELNPSDGEIQSPFYPDSYGMSLQCTWSLTPPPGSIVHLLITRLRIDQGDFLHVTDGSKNAVLTSTTPPTSDLYEFAPRSSLVIHFLSDDTSNRGYFLLKYDVFDPGSCNFTLTPCGWAALDPLQVWTFSGEDRMMSVEEKAKIGLQLSRGYRTTLASPLITPKSPGGNMCLQFRYKLTGQDAFKMTVSIRETDSKTGNQNVALLKTGSGAKSLMKMRGAQGKFLLNAAVNFTTSGPFHFLITYERGYGPHYKVGISEIKFSENSCGSELEDLLSFSCVFQSSFCGWKNTHTDHRNWELGDDGVTALTEERLGTLWQKKKSKWQEQRADLVSPIVTNSGSNTCLKLSFQIHSPMVELKLLVSEVVEDGTRTSIFVRKEEDNLEIWGQGRVSSPKFLHASVPLNMTSLPARFKVTLRAVSVTSLNPYPRNSFDSGVSVKNIQMNKGKCADVFNCNFDNGFCAWKIISTGNSVWHIKEDQNKSFSALLSQGSSGDSSQMISPQIGGRPQKSLSFRYLIQDTNQCIKIDVAHGGTPPFDGWRNSTTQLIWDQCRAKGNFWLHECINLPASETSYQIMIGSGTGYESSKVWLDDINISEAKCPATISGTVSQKTINKGFSWECQPKSSLCGMTQPLPGLWDWEYSQLSSSKAEIRHEPKHPRKENSFRLPFPSDEISEPELATTQPRVHDSPLRDNLQNIFKGMPNGGKDLPRDSKKKFPHNPESGSQKDPHKFLCPNGRQLNPTYICDGIPDCEDRSDEKGCDCGPDGCVNFDDDDWSSSGIGSCGEAFFMCPSGKNCLGEGCPASDDPCLPRHFICDGQPHCLQGEDEHACGPAHRSNNYSDFGHGWMSDSPILANREEIDKKSLAKRETGDNWFECSGGLLLPRSFLCDGRKDCPLDGLDEVGCFHCGPKDFLCPVSGICLPKSVVCDGELNIPTCTDEFTCGQCSPGHFACDDFCLLSGQVCDGVWDCNNGEDENRCVTLEPATFSSMMGNSPYSSEPLIISPGGRELPPQCEWHRFRCADNRCLPTTSVCNRQHDCARMEDERDCADDNREEEFFISAKPSAIHKPDPLSQFPSYLITPILRHEKGRIGLLSFRYRLDAWIGPSNITLSIEILNATETSNSLVPWALWRQAGHRGKQWLNAEVIIPELPDIRYYRLVFLLSGRGMEHGSQQIHLAKISFKTVVKEDLNKIGLAWSNCGFGTTWCGWSQAYTEHGYAWVHAMTSPHSRRTGPITGFSDDFFSGFIFTDSLLGSEGDSADLLSPLVQFQKKDQSLCLRFAMFLYGAHIAQLSVHVMQVTTTGHPVTVEIFHTAGGRGLSWIPVSLTIDDVMLREPSEPFLIVIRATRGNGPEADIALDQISFSEGSCYKSPVPNPDLLLAPLTSASSSYLRSFKAGPSFTPFDPPTERPVEFSATDHNEGNFQGKTQNSGGKGKAGLANLCSLYESCHSCVVASTTDCVWCITTHACRGSLLPEARNCPALHAVHSNATGEVRSGSIWCPRVAPGQASSIYVPADSSLSLAIAVTNIEVSHTNLNWDCVFTVESQPKNMAEQRLTDQPSLANEIQSAGLSSKSQKTQDDDEELWRSLKSYAMRKKYEKKVVKIPGQFEGTVFSSRGIHANAGQVGVGIIKCESSDTLITIPAGETMATAKIELHTPNGGVLDNPEDVHLIVFRCEEMATECETCLSLNASFPCGWCPITDSCTHRSLCNSALWHSPTSLPSRVCSVQEELDFLKDLLDGETEDDLSPLGEGLFGEEFDFVQRRGRKIGNKKKVRNKMRKSLRSDRRGRRKNKVQYDTDLEEKEGMEEEDVDIINKSSSRRRNKQENKKKKAKDDSLEKTGVKENSVRFAKKSRTRGFLKVPTEDGVFVARDVWRLHTGRQYYVPVNKKTLINLGFVRHVTYGRLSTEKSRTVLMEGAWKKAAGFFIDLFEKAGQDPMTSIITTKKEIYDKMIAQILPE